MPYILKRIFFSIFVIAAIAIITFVIVRILPGDPVAMWVGDRPTQEQLERARVELGYDQPIYLQLGKYLFNLAQGDFGTSLRTRRPVSSELGKRFAATFELTTLAMAFCLIFGVPLGVLAANAPGHWLSKVEKYFSLSGIAIPIFWLGMLLQMFFAGALDWLPLQGQRALPLPAHQPTGLLLLDTLFSGEFDKFHDALQHIFLPALTLSMACFGLITRTVRNAISQALSQDYIRTAHAFGVAPRRILFVHALKNAMIPLVTISGLAYGYLLGGTFLVERVFDWQGLGQFAVLSILANDLPAVTGVAMIYALVYSVINLALDIVYSRLDPRISIS